jgi:alcohol dehydrogenase (cytochrome c)
MTVAPLVADGVILTGISGAEFGTRDFIDGWDPQSGEHLWRTYTIPGPGEPGHDTWPGDTWKLGGGSTWITGSFDPELHTVYWGVGNPGPFNATGRPGDNLYTCSVLALDPKTGKIKWHYQFSPNNPFDYDSVAEMVLATLNINGTPTKVMMDANRNGFFCVIDRTNGKLLAANPYVQVNWASAIDLKTGRPIETDVTSRQVDGFDVVLVGADIADMRESEGDDLPGIGGIGEDLVVAGHRGVEADFADGMAGGAEARSLEHGTEQRARP